MEDPVCDWHMEEIHCDLWSLCGDQHPVQELWYSEMSATTQGIGDHLGVVKETSFPTWLGQGIVCEEIIFTMKDRELKKMQVTPYTDLYIH